MKIIYSPFYSGSYYLNMTESRVALDVQVLETQGLLSQLALHAGIHQQIPSYPERLISYHKTLLEYDKSNQENIFHGSIVINSMSVAKMLLRWRDSLALCGWSSSISLPNCNRLNTLAEIDSNFKDEGTATLLTKLSAQIKLMKSGSVKVPDAYKNLIIEIHYPFQLLPDYIKPLLCSLKDVDVKIEEITEGTNSSPKAIIEIHFSQLWKAEVWLSQQQETAYDVWINTNNKRIDNWLHMSGKPVCGSEMTATNPQVTQMFLLAVQLFQRPLNLNTLLQYLYLSECPLHTLLRRRLAKVIANEGGFCNEKVQECINTYIEKEFKADGDTTPPEYTKEQREENYKTYLPFDLRNDANALPLAEESDVVNTQNLKTFLSAISSYASSKAQKIQAMQPYDARIAQLRNVAEMTDALINLIDTLGGVAELPFTTLSQWAQSLYEDGDYLLYPAQVGSRCILNNPSNMIGLAKKTIWCDFYGDLSNTLSTDFLSNYEVEQLKEKGVLLWNKQHEIEFFNQMLAQPIYKTTDELTIVTCDQQGATKLPVHPLSLQLPTIKETKDGDELYKVLATQEIQPVDNHCEKDSIAITFDAKTHQVTWREVESYSALEKLLQNPYDYFMNYTLQFTDISEADINIFQTYGNVAHKVVETLFTAERNGTDLLTYVKDHYEEELNKALLKKGALLLLPEYHLDRERLRYRFRSCVEKLATIIQENGLTVVGCEQKEKEDLGLDGGVLIQGFIDMLLRDNSGNDVIFDLKYVAKKDKYKTVLEKNRALQLAIYKEMLLKPQPSKEVRTAYFVMPYGILFSTDDFYGTNCQQINADSVDLMEQLRKGYAERVREINEGRIETSDNQPIIGIPYANVEGVYPLEDDGKKKEPKKAENLYSNYKSFTI